MTKIFTIIGLVVVAILSQIQSTPQITYVSPHIVEASFSEPVAPAVDPKPIPKPILNPAMRPICACESRGNRNLEPTQYEADGVTVLSGRVNPKDRGLCQINQDAWLDTAEELDYDIETEAGNIEMANWIYDHEGTRPWRYSQACWQKEDVLYSE